jgi:hypothetical protein
MEDLIKALQIFLPYYYGGGWPTHCEHDVMYVTKIDVSKMDVSTVRELDGLGFMPGWGDEDYDAIKDALGEDFAMSGDYGNITDEQWDKIKNKISDSFYSYRFGSC